MSRLLISVPTQFGLESLAAKEIRNLGYETERVEDGRISYYGDERAVCRSNIWLRTAERVQLKIGDFHALSFTELFDQVKALPWPDLLPKDAIFPVSGHSLASKLGSVPDCQSIIKKAVVESMKSRWKTDRFAETGSLYRINFNIIRNRTTVYIDTSGEGLHKRGYREASALAPIRETLASALVTLSGWRPGKALWDPFCGSGTIPIEAAMIAANRAPGLERDFAAESWTGAQYGRIFAEERANARSLFEKPAAADPVIVGSDLSGQYIKAARKNASKAGIAPLIRFFQMDSKDMDRNSGRLAELGVRFSERGCVVTNPPYGERQDDLAAAREACRDWAPALNGFLDWGWCVISAIDGFERIIGRAASKRRKLSNGKIKCNAYQYWN
jgi:putative N6-adenine-specific DNA methylase